MGYAGGGKFLLCQVLVGQTYKMPDVEMGCKLKHGYHSHSSPCGSEIVSYMAHLVYKTVMVSIEKIARSPDLDQATII